MKTFITHNQCVTCGETLTGLKTTYCNSLGEKNSSKPKSQTNNSYEAQQKRSKDRKLKLIEMYGGKCGVCGYNKNYACLSFHHRNPLEKQFSLDGRKLSNCKWESIIEEAKKCELLCLNCHQELHNPNCSMFCR